MRPLSLCHRAKSPTRRLRRHLWTGLTAATILVLGIGYGVASTRASVSGGLGPSNELSVRTCSDAGTLFEGRRLAADVMQIFRTTVSAVVAERETYLEKSSRWVCEGEPNMPLLSLLADRLPGWHYPIVSDGGSGLSVTYYTRPVTFDAFSSILGEFLREYECKLTDLQGHASEAVLYGDDTFTPCLSAPCPAVSTGDIGVRPGSYVENLQLERHRARVALERTLHSLRSFDVQYEAARNLLCYERAVLDLRNEMSLIADATSCMPKIWDAVTSLHDRKE